MLIWLVIIFVLLMIFGVIKVEMLQNWGTKAADFLQENLKRLQEKSQAASASEPKKEAKADKTEQTGKKDSQQD
ncbi:MAG: hypothetical protein IJ184_02845 [Alphaproteobacteria bacterium]|nr:hypothetical protein [Alphaproteobacteria bacterium]